MMFLRSGLKIVLQRYPLESGHCGTRQQCQLSAAMCGHSVVARAPAGHWQMDDFTAALVGIQTGYLRTKDF